MIELAHDIGRIYVMELPPSKVYQTRDERRAYEAKWREKNREKVRAYSRQWMRKKRA